MPLARAAELRRDKARGALRVAGLGRAGQTGTPERTIYRKVARFEAEGMDSLFAVEGAKRRSLPPAMRRLVVDLKAEHPPMRPHDISTVCYVRFGRRPNYRTVERVLAEEPMPLTMVRRFPPYHEAWG